MNLLLTIITLFYLTTVTLAYDPMWMLCLVNRERAKRGIPSLGYSAALHRAAAVQSRFQARIKAMSHKGDGGSLYYDRIERAGYDWSTASENVAFACRTEAACMQLWMNSPAHRDNILGRQFTHFGSAVSYSADRTPFYTQDFAGDGRRHSFPVCPRRRN